jgi:hypothetical protein
MALESYIELQVDLDAIKGSFAAAVGLQVIPQIGKQFTVGATQYVVQNVQVGSASLLPAQASTATVFSVDGLGDVLTDSIPCSQVAFSVPVTYQLMSENISVGSFDLVATLDLSLTSGFASFGPPPTFAPVQMILSCSGVTGGGANPALAAQLQTMLSTAVEPVLNKDGSLAGGNLINAPLPIGSIGIASNTGVVIVPYPGGSLIALRLQLGMALEQYTTAIWTQFYAGTNVSNHLQVTSASGNAQNGNVSIFLSSDLVVGLVKQAIQAGVDANSDKMQIQGGISANWAPAADGTPHLNANFIGIVFDQPLPNLQVGITAGIDFSVVSSPSDTLQIHSHFDWSVNPAQAFLDVLLAALTGFALGAEFTGGLGAIPGLLVGLVGSILAIALFTPSLSTSACVQSGNDVTCTFAFKVPAGPGTTLPVIEFRSAFGDPDGMVIFSQLDLGPLIIFLSLGNLLKLKNFNFANGLRSLGVPVINAAYIISQSAVLGLPFSL